MGAPNFAVIDEADLPTNVTQPKVRSPAKRRSIDDQNRQRSGRELKVADPADAREYIPEDEVALTDDLAATVVRKTMKRIAAGKVEPTLREGLQAQQILDRRAEKAADRRFMLALSQALAGGGAPAPAQLLPGEEEGVIEGSFEDVDLAPAHLRSET